MSEDKEKTGNVVTEDVPRPTDESITTSDLPTENVEHEKPKAKASNTESSNDQNLAPGTEKEKKRQSYLQRKQSRLERDLAAEKSARQSDRDRIAQLEAKLDEVLADKSSTPTPKPKLADFDTPEEFADAYALWKDKSKPKANAAPPTKKPAATPPPISDENLPDEIKTFKNKGKELLGDQFLEALEEDIPVTKDMAEYMFDSEYGAHVYVHLSNNPDVAMTLAKSSPVRMIKIMDKLEADAKAGKLDVLEDGEMHIENDDDSDDEAKKSPGKTESKAPKAPSSTREKGRVKPEPDLESMSMDDYAAKRHEDEKKKRMF